MEFDSRDLRARIARFDSVTAIIIQNLLVKMKILTALLDPIQAFPSQPVLT